MFHLSKGRYKMSEAMIVAGMTLRDAALAIAEALPGYYAEARERQAMSEMLLQHITGLSQTNYLLDRKVRQLSDTEAVWLQQALERLAHDEPIQYILGVAPFGSFDLAVGKGVLIPRSETAELCELILARHPATEAPQRLLDVGCGSACIPIYIGSHRPRWQLYAMDQSEQALHYAEQNVRQTGVAVQLFRGDLFAWCLGKEIPSMLPPIDLLVSNPPYIPECDKATMRPNVLVGEPREALFVPDEDPLCYYRALVTLVPRIRSPHAPLTLYCETHHQLAHEVAALCKQAGATSSEVLLDLTGRERFVQATF